METSRGYTREGIRNETKILDQKNRFWTRSISGELKRAPVDDIQRAGDLRKRMSTAQRSSELRNRRRLNVQAALRRPRCLGWIYGHQSVSEYCKERGATCTIRTSEENPSGQRIECRVLSIIEKWNAKWDGPWSTFERSYSIVSSIFCLPSGRRDIWRL
jgi:hypothetical protein